MAHADSKISLRAFRVDLNGVDLKTGLPERLKIFNWGDNRINTGETFRVDEETFKVFSANQSEMGRDTVQIDFNHNTVPGTEAYRADKEPRAIAGYGRPLCVKGEGIFVEQVSTTPSGIKSAADYKDLSPTPLIVDGRIVGLHSVALTPTGAVDNLTIADAALRAMASEISIPNAYKNGADNNQGFNSMDLKPFRDADVKGEMKGMSDEEAMKFIMARWCGMCGAQGPITPEKMNQTPTWDDNWGAKPAAIEGTLKTLTATIATLTAELDKQKSADAKAQKDSIIALAAKEGKPITLTAEQLATFTPDQLKVMVAAIPAGIVPRSPLRPQVTGQTEIKPLSAMTPQERTPVLAQLRARSMDLAAGMVARLRSGQAVNQ